MANLNDLLGIRLPIIQAPMAGVSSPAMAAAVGAAGGLGSIAVGAAGPEGTVRMIQDLRSLWAGSFNINLFCHQSAAADPVREAAWIERFRPIFAGFGAEPPTVLREIYKSFVVDPDMLTLLLVEKPAVVSFHFGLPDTAVVRTLRQAGIFLMATATNLVEAKAAEAAGIQALVAQGYEAGGHRGMFDPDADDARLGTADLTRLLVSQTSLPVIAAGGIMDGADIAATLKLGAAAAQLGTAFVGTDESLADDAYKAALFGDAAHHTVMTRVISGRPARGLANRFTALGETIAADAVPAYPIAYDLGKALNGAAKAKGQSGYGAQWAGTGAARARRMPAGDLVALLAAELAAHS